MARPLVIGVGDVMRSDAAAGIVAVEEIARCFPEAVCLCVAELRPELAEQVSAAGTVVFVEASVLVQALSIRQLRPGQSVVSSHAATPEILLGICEQVHGGAPGPAYLVEIPAHHLGFGDAMTAATRAAVMRAVGTVIGVLSGVPGRTQHSGAVPS